MTLDEDITIVCAFRYALGRQTYVVSSVANEIKRLAQKISIKSRHLIIREIKEAIDGNKAGMQMDADEWIACRQYLINSLEGTEHPYSEKYLMS